MTVQPLKSTRIFQTIYRRGRWARGTWLSIGVLLGEPRLTRVGIRTRRGFKGAVLRNRLKRQLKAIVYGKSSHPLQLGLDVVIVLHPPTLPVSAAKFQEELTRLCQRLKVLREAS